MVVVKKGLHAHLIDHISDMVAILDPHGTITYANHALLHFLHMSIQEIQGKDFFDYIESTDRTSVKKRFKSLVKRKEPSCTLSFILIGARDKHLSVSSTFTNLIDDQILKGVVLSIRDITETKNLKQQLFDTKKEMKKIRDNAHFITNNSLDVIFQVTLTGEFVYMNPASMRIAGYDPQEMIGRKWMEYVPKKELVRYLTQVKQILKGKKIDDFQTFIIHKEGYLVPVEFSGTLVKKDNKTYINGVMRDMSHRIESKKQLEQIAQSLQKQLRAQEKALEETTKQLREREKLYETLFNELPMGATLTDETGMPILEINKKLASNFKCTPKDLIGKNWKEILPKDTFHTRYEYGKKAIETKTIQTLVDKRGGFWFKIYFVPLVLSNDKQYAFIIADDITVEKNQEGAIREREEQYRMLFEHAGEAIAVAQNNYIRLANPKFKEMAGRTYEDIYATPFIEFIHPEDRALVADRYQQRISGKTPPSSYEFRFISKDGSVHWAHITAIGIQYEGKPATLNFLIDITKEILTTEALKDSEEQFRAITISAQDTIIMVDQSGKIEFWNPSAERIFKYTSDEIIRQSIYKIFNTAQDKKTIRSITEEDTNIERVPPLEKIYDMSGHTKQGISIPIAVTFSRIRFREKGYTVIIARDISERKRMEQQLKDSYVKLEERVRERTAELQASEQRYHELFEHAAIGMGLANYQKGITSVNSYMMKLFGFSSPKEFKQRDGLSYVENNLDRKKLIDEFETHGHIHNTHITFRRKDATSFVGLCNIDPIKIGNEESLFITVRDVTELVQSQKVVSETRDFLDNVLNSASEFIMAIDATYNITMWNNTAVDLTGYPKKDVIGQSLKQCTCFDNVSHIVDFIKNILEGNPDILDDVIVHPKTGSKRVLTFSCSVIRSTAKEFLGILFVGQDITLQSTLHGKLLQGNSYLILDASADQALTVFSTLQLSGYHGLLFSRGDTAIHTSKNKAIVTQIHYFCEYHGDTPQQIRCLDDVYTHIDEFIQTHDPAVILLDRLDYLILNHSYKDVLKLIYKVNALISSAHVILLIRLNESLLLPQDLAILQEEVHLLPTQQIDTIKLDEDLYNILRFVYEQNKQNLAVTFKKISTHFSISKVTTQKRIYDLEYRGVLAIIITGRMKQVYVTREGELLLHSRTAA